MEYTLGLALFDFLPVILSIAGLLLLSGMIYRLDELSGRMAYLATALIAVGGLSKVIWKLAVSTTGQDIVWMSNMLFLFLGPGFTFFAWALWNARLVLSDRLIPRRIWLRPVAVIALFALGAIAAALTRPDERTWVYILLTLTTGANLAVSILLVSQSRRQGLGLAAILFIINIIAVFLLSGLARIPEQTVLLQWIEEGVNLLAQGAFLIAAYQLSRSPGNQPAAKIVPIASTN